jgi:hypothetical protein
MQKISLLILSIVLAVLLLAGGVYWVLMDFQRKASVQATDPFLWIPGEARLVIHLKKPSLVGNSLKQTGSFKDELDKILNLEGFSDFLLMTDSLIDSSPYMVNIWNHSQAVISLVPTHTGETDLFVQITLPGMAKPERLKHFIGDTLLKQIHLTQGFIGNEDFFTIHGNNRKYHYIFRKNVLLITTRAALAGTSHSEPEEQEGIMGNIQFKALRNRAGRFTDNIYVKTASLCQRMPAEYTDHFPFTFSCSDLAGWHTWDLSYQTEGLSLTGLAYSDDSGEFLADYLTHQKANSTDIQNHWPHNAATVVYVGLSDIDAFSDAYRRHMISRNMGESWLKDQQSQFFDITGMQHQQLPTVWTGEAAWLLQGKNQHPAEGILLLGFDNPAALLQNPELSLYISGAEWPIDSLQGKIMQQNIPGLFPLLTHGLIKTNPAWFSFSGEYLVASHSATSLQNYFRSLNSGFDFTMSDAAMNAREYLQESQNFFFFSHGFNPANPTDQVPAVPGEANHSFMLQMLPSPSGKLFSNGLLIYQKTQESEAPRDWEIGLNAPVLSGPYGVVNHNSGRIEFILQDQTHQLWLIDKDGNVLWKRSLNGPILSEVFQVDVFKNDRLQFLFNTRNYLHLIDRNGNYVSGYPMKLPASATTGITLCDYDNNKNYRILFPAENRRIYNYNLQRQRVAGWQYRQSSQPITHPVQYLKMGDKDYLVVVDNTGKIEIIDRRGLETIKIPAGLSAFPGTQAFTAKSSDGRNYIMLGHKRGGLLKIYQDGASDILENPVLTPGTAFSVYHTSENATINLILLNNEGLKILNPELENTGDSSLDVSLRSRMENIKHSRLGHFVSITDPDRNRIYLMTPSGKIIYPFPLEGDTRIVLGEDQYGDVFLVTGAGSQLRKYNLGNWKP